MLTLPKLRHLLSLSTPTLQSLREGPRSWSFLCYARNLEIGPAASVALPDIGPSAEKVQELVTEGKIPLDELLPHRPHKFPFAHITPLQLAFKRACEKNGPLKLETLSSMLRPLTLPNGARPHEPLSDIHRHVPLPCTLSLTSAAPRQSNSSSVRRCAILL